MSADRREYMRLYQARRRSGELPPARLFTTPPAWYQHAACRGLDPNLFHPLPNDMSTAANAKRTCQTCPVRPACLEWALEQDERLGIWGGMSPTERRVIRRARGLAA